MKRENRSSKQQQTGIFITIQSFLSGPEVFSVFLGLKTNFKHNKHNVLKESLSQTIRYLSYDFSK